MYASCMGVVVLDGVANSSSSVPIAKQLRDF